jgi:peptide/nickel transport system permease protein
MSAPEGILESEGLMDPLHSEGIVGVEGRSPRQLAVTRFRADTKSMVALGIVVFYVLAAIAAPILVKVGVLDPYAINLDLLNDISLPAGHWWGISSHHLLGVEPGLGRDVLTRLWYGITFSLAISLTASVIAMMFGVFLGIVAGFTGGWVDAVIGRLIDLWLCFPQTIMLIAMSTVVLRFLNETLGIPPGNGAQAIFVIVVLALFGWMPTARLIRGQVLSVRESEFVAAAKLFGASRRRMWFKEILPNLWAPILVNFTLMLPAFISTEAALSYLGVSIKLPTPTLGNLLGDSIKFAQGDFLYFVAPAVLLALIVVAFNLLGDGLRDALDPKSTR